MAYNTFQTEKANYIFSGINHIFGRSSQFPFEGIDALVTEGGEDSPKEIWVPSGERSPLNEKMMFGSAFGHSDLITYTKEEEVPIYQLDPDVTRKGAKHSELLGLALTPLTEVGFFLNFAYSLSSRRMPLIFRRYINFLERLERDPNVIGRSAICAKKIEEFLAPSISKVKNKKPKIGIVYGSGHWSIPDLIENESSRKQILGAYESSGFDDFDKATLDRVVKFDYKHYHWVPETFKAGIF